MATPNTAELLVDQAKEAERLRLKLLAINRIIAEVTDLDALRREVERLNQQQ